MNYHLRNSIFKFTHEGCSDISYIELDGDACLEPGTYFVYISKQQQIYKDYLNFKFEYTRGINGINGEALDGESARLMLLLNIKHHNILIKVFCKKTLNLIGGINNG